MSSTVMMRVCVKGERRKDETYQGELVESNRFVYPRPGFLGVLCNWLANNALLASVRRAIFSRLPFLRLESDVVDVVYLNWVISNDLAVQKAPPGLKLNVRDGKTIFTILTYIHGGFGPSGLGKAREIFPSPLQSNWRLYVAYAPGLGACKNTVLFVRNIFDNPAYAIGARVFSDALPSHLAYSFVHHREGSRYVTEIKGGSGSAPEFSAIIDETSTPELPSAFLPFYASWQEAVKELSEQDSAICKIEGSSRLAQAGIELPINLNLIKPCCCESFYSGEFLDSLGVEGLPFCFAIPNIKFKVLWEQLV